MAVVGASAGVRSKWGKFPYFLRGKPTLHPVQDACRGCGVQVLPGVPGDGDQEL